jgi:hypothetical protein
MTTHYSLREATYLDAKRVSRGGEAVDLVPCSDGILRTAAERDRFERERERALPAK